MHDGRTGAGGVARLVVGPIGSGVTRRLSREERAVRCVGLESAAHPFESFAPLTGGAIDDDPVEMADLVRRSLSGSPIAIDDAQHLTPSALDVVDDLARDHEVIIGAHPGEGDWASLRARWAEVPFEWVGPIPPDVVAAVIAGVGGESDVDEIAGHVGPLPGVGRALAVGGPFASATLERLRSIVERLDDDALQWVVDAALLPPGPDRAILPPPPVTSRAVAFADTVVPPIVTEAVSAAVGPARLAERRRALAELVTDPIARSRLLLDAGAVEASWAVATAALASTADPDRRATLAALAAHDDATALLAASLLVERERPEEAGRLLGRVHESEHPDALRVAAAVGRQRDSGERWDLVDRLEPDDRERHRQLSWFEARWPLDGPDRRSATDPAPRTDRTVQPDPTIVADLDAARWEWTTRAAVSLHHRDGLAPLADALDRSGLGASWRQLVDHLRALDHWHRTGPTRHTVDVLRSDHVPALPRAVLGAHRAIGLADLGDTTAAYELLAGLPTTAPSERLLAAWASAEVELAAGRPIAAMRAAARVEALDHPLAGLSRLVGAWAAWDASEPHEATPPPTSWANGGWSIARATELELDALALIRGDDPGTAAQVFDDAAECWRGIHARGELRCRFGGAEARRLAGDVRPAVEHLTAVEQTCTEHGYGPLLQRVRRSLRLAGVRRRGRRTTGEGPLSAREAEVIELVGKGLTSRDIATRLGVAPATVETQIAAAMHKLGARTRLQAALAYRELAR